eukprot:Gb_25587 [translate_table: standard]
MYLLVSTNPIRKSCTIKSVFVLANSNFVAPASYHTGIFFNPTTRSKSVKRMPATPAIAKRA